jgi:ribosomal protein L37AE/L43A
MFRFVKTTCNADANTSPPAATGGTGSGDSDNNEDISAPTYRAIYVGNHMNAPSREDESKRVDSLVTWAVTNQVLFSWGPIRDDMAMGLFPELVRSRNKRRGGKVAGRPRAKSAKQSADDTPGRSFGDDTDDESCDTPQWMMLYNKPLSSRITSSPSSQLPDAALVALQSFTIRLLSAMHRPILTVLYTKKPDSFLVPDEDKSPSQQFLSRLVGQNLPEKIKEEMVRSRSTSDRTLARIDRRLAAGKYIQGVGDNARDRNYQFYDLVRFVLRSLRHSLDSDDQVSRAAVTGAIEDWARIRDRYLNSDNSKNWWSRGGWLSMSPGAVQSALLAPWAESEKCHICTEDVPSATESDDVWVCSCCATSIAHAKCHPNESVKSRPLSSMLRSYAPLQQVYSLRSPAGLLPIPDYTKKHLRNTIKWSRHTITLDRPIVPGQSLPTWGLGINHLERAEKALDEILEQTFDVTKLSSTDRIGVSRELGSPMPFRLPCPPELVGEGNKNGWKAILVGECV